MKKITLIVFGLLFSINIFALSGGPDLFGYTWKDNTELGGPTYNWVDIVSPEFIVTGLGDDNSRGSFSMNSGGGIHPFTYYWYQVDQLWIGSNGYISFGNINMASIFPSIPDSNDNKHNFIAGLMADLTFTGTGNPAHCYYKVTGNNDSVIISFINVPFYSSNYPYFVGSNTFQIILDKTDNSILVNFQSSTGTTLNSDIKTGIENITGNIGLMPFTGTYPVANKSIKYYYPTNPTYFVHDGAAKWNSQPGSGGLFLPYPNFVTLTSNISNVGNLDISPPFTATGRIKNSVGTYLLNTTVPFTDSLFIGNDSTIVYPSYFIPSATGTYSYTSTISNVSGDAIHSNDSIIQELVMVDTSAFIQNLNYSDNIPDAPGISWTDGMGGLGVYFVPPSYPMTVNSTKFFIESNPNGANFIAKIFDDDGPNGMPGTLLDSVMYNGTIFVGGYNTVNTSNYINIYSGGVYVLWEMYGIGITLARDITPPISYRTFEYVSGMWAPYRINQSEDFLIGITLQKTLVQDIGTTIIVSPLNNATINVITPVVCWIKNYGQQAESNFSVHYKQWGSTIIDEIYSGVPIPAGDSIQFTFSTPLAVGWGYPGEFCVWTTKLNDAVIANDSSCIQLQIVTNINQVNSNSSITVYPNPFSDNTIIEFSNESDAKFEFRLTDLTGKLLRKFENLTGNKIKIDRGILAPGIYFFELKGDKIFKGKLIIE